MISKWVNEGYSPSITYLIARNGIVVSHGSAGTIGPDKDSPALPPDALFPLASITKLFTATAIMILTEEGLLSPVCPVREFIPEFRGEGKDEVLIHHLLTHTSGLKDEDIYKHYESIKDTLVVPSHDENQLPNIQRKLVAGYEAPLTYQLGTYMDYCGYGYELLGEIIRRVSGKSLDEFYRKRIFEPLGLKDTFMIVPEKVRERVVKFSDSLTICGHWCNTKEAYEGYRAASGAYSTVYDTSVFGQMFLNGGKYGNERILSKASVRAMIRNHTKGIPSGWGNVRFPESGWGLGFMISIDKKDESGTLRSPEAFSHSGWGCTYLFMDPVYNTVTAMFQATTKAPINRLNRRFDIFTDMALAAIED